MQIPEDAYSIKVISDPFVAEDGVFFTLHWIEDGEYRSSIYKHDGEEARRMTFGGHERNPVFRDGCLYYVSYSEDNEKLIVIEPFKESRELYSNSSISKFIFHGDSILALTRDKSDPKEPFIASKLKYRFDTDGFLRKRVRLVEIRNGVKELVSGDFDVVDVSSNGKSVVFSATMEDDDKGLEDVYELDIDNGKYSRITAGHGEASPVSITEEGEIAYVGHRKGPLPWAVSSLVLPGKGKEVAIGNTADNSVNSDLFVPGSSKLEYQSGKYYLIGQEGGTSHLYSYDGNRVEKITEGNISVRDFSVLGNRIAYVYTSPEKPSVLDFGTTYDPNPDIRGVLPERIEVEGKEAWIMESSKDSPTILSVHGGPQTAYGYAYSIEFNFLVKNGFNVLYGNPRGSDGYGEEFAAACAGDWGGKDFEDLLRFVDHATKNKGFKDEFAIMGGSYGGYMTNAAIVKTDRFKTAVSERCVSNLMSMCGTSDIGFWFNAIESEVDDPWSEEGMKRLLELSPVTRAGNVKTPTLFIHGEEDYRCPIEQSEQMYTAIKMGGTEAVLARYPGDSHEHARRGVPGNMKDRLRRKLDWFRSHMDIEGSHA